jgi:hypothetical protein
MGWEALGPSEPRHSPNKATLSYYTKNESVASGISKMWCMLRFPREGVFIGSWGSSTDLAEAVTQKVAAGWPSRMSYPVPRNRERSLHTCAQDVQITRMATIG